MWILTNGLADAAIEKIVGLFDGGVEVGFRVHEILVEGDSEGLLGVGEELKVDDLVGKPLAVGIGGSQVRVFRLVEGVFGIVVAEVVFECVERCPLDFAVFGMRYGSAAYVVHPTAPLEGWPVDDCEAREGIAVDFFKLFKGEVGVLETHDANIPYCNGFWFDVKLVGLVGVRIHGEL